MNFDYWNFNLKKLLNKVIDSSNLKTAVEKSLEIAEKLSQLWVSASYEDKQILQHLVFPDGAVYSKQKHEGRTERVNTLFVAIAEQARVSGENKNGDSSMNRQNSSQVLTTNPSTKIFCEDLRNLLKYQIKTTR